MVKVAFALLASASAGTLNLTWEDCGDASTHAKVNDVSPSTIESGTTSKVIGTGDLDEDIAGASFSATIKASGVTVSSCDGDASKDVVCKLPLGVGSITLKAVTFPLKAGSVPINTEVQLSSLIPTSLAKTDIHVEGTADTGDKLVCLDLHTAQAGLGGVDCSASACPTECECSLDKCADSINTCLADAQCAQGQACALQCACGDTACNLQCAAATPSPKALPVATCINSNCAGLKTAGVDCTQSACPSQCECSLDKCADSINTCLADATCAQGQACALTCACGDTACSLQCAAETPSPKALPVATCINSNCAGLKSAGVDCTQSACPSQCECSLDKCADSINTCLADATCAQGQACALTCACGDTACSLKCAAETPSPKALPVATCINSNCAGLKSAGVDCTQSACPSQCECSLDKCADSINTCLADATCAQGQACALTCACGDTACSLKCAAETPSPKALPVATCINSNCASSVEV